MKSPTQLRHVLLVAAALGIGTATFFSFSRDVARASGTEAAAVAAVAVTAESSKAPVEIPEPASMILLGTGLVGLAGLVRRTNRK